MKKGLGKGLDALFEDNLYDLEGQDTDGAVKQVRLSEIEPDKTQPRKSFDPEAMEQLAASIREHGLIQPILAAPLEDGRYRIIAGERRWRACRMAGLEEVPVLIRGNYTPQQISEVSLIENLQREDLNPVEEAAGYKRLMDQYGLTQAKIAKTVSKSRSAVANALRLLSLPEQILDFLKTGELTAGHARALLSVGDRDLQLTLANRIITEGLSVRQTETLTARAGKEKRAALKADPGVLMALHDLEERASAHVGNRVIIRHKADNKGRVEIPYYSVDELEKIIAILEGERDS